MGQTVARFGLEATAGDRTNDPDRRGDRPLGMQVLTRGMCGEHGGDAASIRFFVEAGLDDVSCSPFRVPVARLAAAQTIIGTDDDTR